MFYVYTYSFDGVPRYIGKGAGARWRAHRKLNTHLGYAIRSYEAKTGCWPTPTILHFALEEKAFEYEAYLVAKHGRIINDTGTLWNIVEGGRGVPGLIHSQASKVKIKSAYTSVDFRIKHSDSIKKGMRRGDNWVRFLETNKVSKNTEEYKVLRSSLSKKIMTPEMRRQIRETVLRISSTQEYRESISRKTKAALSAKATRLKMSKAARARMEREGSHNKLADLARKFSAKEKSDRSRRFSDEKILEVYFSEGLHKDISEKTGVSASHVSAIKRLARPVYKLILETYERNKNGITIS